MLILPATLGQSAGADLYNHDMQVFSQGCKAATANQHCVQVLKLGHVGVQGFLIDSSPTHIAIYDLKLKQARAFERAGMELRAL